jgi:hypothetical protein
MTDNHNYALNTDSNSIATGYLTAKCPHCDREERFENAPTGEAWLYAHIRKVHGDELPPIKNTDA